MQFSCWIVLILLELEVCAQPPNVVWSRTFGTTEHDVCYDLCVSNGGGFVMAGTTYNGSVDFWAVSVSANGDSLWSRQFGGLGNQYCYDIDRTSDGGYILCGYTESGNGEVNDFWVLRISDNGDSLWSQTFDGHGDEFGGAWSVHETSDGGYFVAGRNGLSGFVLIKMNSSGDSLWSRTYGEPNPWGCYDAAQTADGGFVLFGADFVVIKTNANGDSLWSRTYADFAFERCNAGIVTQDGGFALAGFGNYQARRAFRLLRLDANGDSLWNQTDSTQSVEECWSVNELADGGFILGGRIWSDSSGAEAKVLKTDSLGRIMWNLVLGGLLDENILACHENSDQSLILAGSTASYGQGQEDFWLLKLAPQMSVGVPSVLPSEFSLYQNYPNPFNEKTEIAFTLPITAAIRLIVYDVMGRQVCILMQERLSAGLHRIDFDANGLTSGTYLYRLESGDEGLTRRMILLR